MGERDSPAPYLSARTLARRRATAEEGSVKKDASRRAGVRIFESGGVRVDWNADERSAVIACDPDCDLSGENARALIAALDPHVEAGRVSVLCRGTNLGPATVACAMAWVDFLRRHRGSVQLVVYDLAPAAHAMLTVVLGATRGTIQLAESEDAARETARALVFSAARDPSPS